MTTQAAKKPRSQAISEVKLVAVHWGDKPAAPILLDSIRKAGEKLYGPDFVARLQAGKGGRV